MIGGKVIVMKKLFLIIILLIPVHTYAAHVYYTEEGFVLRQDQKSLTYINSKDDIPGRFLYDQEDVTDDYQVHVIYILAKDSKDKKWDTKGTIEKIVLRANKKFKQKTKDNKQWRLDMTKDGKVDVSFIRLNITNKELGARDTPRYLGKHILRNGFYHPKKIYAIFYQDRIGETWAQVEGTILMTPTGPTEVMMGIMYLGFDSIGNFPKPYLHEMIHTLGFVQLCAPGAIGIQGMNAGLGGDDHLRYRGDVMSQIWDDGSYKIDRKSSDYYLHSNLNCEMDLSKSVFLEPTVQDSQLIPRLENCKIDREQKHYNHERALACLNRLNFGHSQD